MTATSVRSPTPIASEQADRAARKYVWTDALNLTLRQQYNGTIKGRARELATHIGFPVWEIKRRAAHLGLTYSQDRRPWTKEEEQFVEEHAGSWMRERMAKKLKRSLASVIMKCKHMKLRTRFRDGYTLRELEEAFGQDHHTIERWVKDGKLKVRYRGTNRDRDAWNVSERAILDFITNYPMTFRIQCVDQLWLLDLLLGGAIIKRALATAQRATNNDVAA